MPDRVKQRDVDVSAIRLLQLVLVLVDVHREHDFVCSVDMLERKQPPAAKEHVVAKVVKTTAEFNTSTRQIATRSSSGHLPGVPGASYEVGHCQRLWKGAMTPIADSERSSASAERRGGKAHLPLPPESFCMPPPITSKCWVEILGGLYPFASRI